MKNPQEDGGGDIKNENLKFWFNRYFIILQNGQTYFKNLAVWTPQDFQSMFDYFATLSNKGLIIFYLTTHNHQKLYQNWWKISCKTRPNVFTMRFQSNENEKTGIFDAFCFKNSNALKLLRLI